MEFNIRSGKPGLTGLKRKKAFILYCQGIKDLSTVCLYFNSADIGKEGGEKKYCAGVNFNQPRWIDKKNELGSMQVTTRKRTLNFDGIFGNLLSLRALCIGLQENGKNSCTYCRSPQKCPVSRLLKNLNRR